MKWQQRLEEGLFFGVLYNDMPHSSNFPEASCCIKDGKLPRPSETGSWWKWNQEVESNEEVHILDYTWISNGAWWNTNVIWKLCKINCDDIDFFFHITNIVKTFLFEQASM